MSTVPAEELAERRALGDRYNAQRRINEIDGLIRGYRAAVNLIIREEKALLKEKESLQEVEGLGNKKYDLEKAKEDCRRHEDALEEAQSCMCGHCHECGFDPSEMKAALDEVERLRSVISEPVKSFGTMELVSWVNQLQKTISEYPDAEWGNWPFVLMMGVHCENFSKRWHSPTIELMAARIKELEAEVEAKQANNEYLQKMTEEAQGIMQESQLLLCKEANEAEQLQNEVERLRSENKIISDRAAHHDRQDAKEIELLAARIAELEAGKLMYEEIAESYQIGVDDLRAYIKRLEAAFLEAEEQRLAFCKNFDHDPKDRWVVVDMDGERMEAEAREALERIKEGKG